MRCITDLAFSRLGPSVLFLVSVPTGHSLFPGHFHGRLASRSPLASPVAAHARYMRASLWTGGAAIAAHLRRGRPLAQIREHACRAACDRLRGGGRSIWELARASRQPDRGQIGAGRLLCRTTATDPAHNTLSMPVQVILR